MLAIISKTPHNVKESEKRFLDPSLYLNLHRGLFWVLLESVRLFCGTLLTNQPTHQQTDGHGGKQNRCGGTKHVNIRPRLKKYWKHSECSEEISVGV